MALMDLLVWPSGPDVRSTDGDGMSVVAYWPAGDFGNGFDRLLGDTVITAGHGRADVEQVFPRYMDLYDVELDDPDPQLLRTSRPMDAVIVIGFSDEVWWDVSADRYWQAARDDLTGAGRALLESLDEVYGRRAVLLTELST